MEGAMFLEVDFTSAKAGLSGYTDKVVHDRRMVGVNRHGGKEQMLLLARQELKDLLEGLGPRFETRVIFDEDEVSVSLPDFSLIGSGKDFDAAVDDALALLRDYCRRHLERLDFYRQTDRRTLTPLVYLFALTPEDEQRELLLRPPGAVA